MTIVIESEKTSSHGYSVIDVVVESEGKRYGLAVFEEELEGGLKVLCDEVLIPLLLGKEPLSEAAGPSYLMRAFK